MVIVKKTLLIFGLCIFSLYFPVWSEETAVVNNVADNSLGVDSDLPVVTVQKVDGGVQQITVVTKELDGSDRKVIVKVDPHGNKEVVIETMGDDGKKNVSVLGKDSQVEVQDSPRVTIGEDGTLVSQESALAASSTSN